MMQLRPWGGCHLLPWMVMLTLLFACTSSSLVMGRGTWNRVPAGPPPIYGYQSVLVEISAKTLFPINQTITTNNDTCTSSNRTSFILTLHGIDPITDSLKTTIYLLPWPLTDTRTGQQRWIKAPTIGSQPLSKSSPSIFHSPTSAVPHHLFAFGGATIHPWIWVTGSLWALNLETTSWTPLGPSKMYDASNPDGYVCNGKPQIYVPNTFYAFPASSQPTVDDCYFSSALLAQTDEFGCPWPLPRETQATAIVNDAVYISGGIIDSNEVIGDLWRLKLDANLTLAIEQQSTSVGGVYVYNSDQLKYLANSSDPTINHERLCPVKWELLSRPQTGTSQLANQPLDAPHPENLWIHNAASSGNFIALYGGYNAYYSHSDVLWLLDTVNLAWHQLTIGPFNGATPLTRSYASSAWFQLENIGDYLADPSPADVIACAGKTVTVLAIAGGIDPINTTPNDMWLLLPDCSAAIPVNQSLNSCPSSTFNPLIPANSANLTWTFHRAVSSFSPPDLTISFSNPSVRFGNQLIMMPGRTLSAYSKSVVWYDFDTKIGTQAALPFASSQLQSVLPTRTIPSSRYSHASFLFGELMYVFGGLGVTQANNEMWTYHVAHYEWTLVGSMNSTVGTGDLWPPFFQTSMLASDATRIYQFGGGSTTAVSASYLTLPSVNCTNHFYVFDTVTQKWTNLTNQFTSSTPWTNATSAHLTGGVIINGYLYPRARCGAQGAILSQTNELYIFGGEIDNADYGVLADNALWKLNLTSFQWSLVQATDASFIADDSSTQRPSVRKYHNMVAINPSQFLVCFGSNDRYGSLYTGVFDYSSCWLFDSTTTRWKFVSNAETPNSPTARAALGMTLYTPRTGGSFILCHGGSDQIHASLPGSIIFVLDLTTWQWSQIVPNVGDVAPGSRTQHTLVAVNEAHEILLYGDPLLNDQVVHILHMEDMFVVGHAITANTLPHDWLSIMELDHDAVQFEFKDMTVQFTPFAFKRLSAAMSYLQDTAMIDGAQITILDTATDYDSEATRYLPTITINRNMTIRGQSGQQSVLVCDDNPLFDCFFTVNTQSSGATSSSSFSVTSTTNEIVYFQDFTFLNGHSSSKAGAMFIQNSQVELTNVDLLNNVATTFGGAIAMENSQLTLSSCNISNNYAGAVGGGIYSLNSVLTIESSSFESNSVNTDIKSSNGQGGAIGSISTSITVRDSLFRSNRARVGGGMFMNALQSEVAGSFASVAIGLRDATFNVDSTRFEANMATANGGALYFSRLSAATEPFLNNSVLISNIAFGDGAAVHTVGSQLVANYSTFTQNLCFGAGGSVFWDASVDNLGLSPIFYPQMDLTETSDSMSCTRAINSTVSGTIAELMSTSSLKFDHSCNAAVYGPFAASTSTSLLLTPHGRAAASVTQSSGDPLSDPIMLWIIDYYGQAVLTDSKTFVSVDPLSSFSGTTSVRAVNGAIYLDQLTVKIPPKSSVNVTFTSSTDLPFLAEDIASGLLTLALSTSPDLSSGLKTSSNTTFAQLAGCFKTCNYELPQTVPDVHVTYLRLTFATNLFKHDYDKLVVKIPSSPTSTSTLVDFVSFIGSSLSSTDVSGLSKFDALPTTYSVDLAIPSSKVTISLQTGDDSLGYVSGSWNFSSSCIAGQQLDIGTDACYSVTESSAIARGIIIGFSALAIACVLVSFFLLHRYRRAQLFRVVSLGFSGVTLGLLLLLPIAAILFSLVPSDSSDAICIARIWFGSIPLVGVLSILLAKTLRVVKIAHSSALKPQTMKGKEMWLIVAICLTAQLAFCIGFTVMPLSKSVLQLHHHSGSNDQLIRQCSIESDFSTWFGLQLGYIATLCIGAAYLSFLSRGVPSQFNESSHVANALFMLILAAVILVPVGVLVQDQPDAMVIIQGGGATFITLMWTGVLFGPKFWHVHQSLVLYKKQTEERKKAEEQAKNTALAMRLGLAPKAASPTHAGGHGSTPPQHQSPPPEPEPAPLAIQPGTGTGTGRGTGSNKKTTSPKIVQDHHEIQMAKISSVLNQANGSPVSFHIQPIGIEDGGQMIAPPLVVIGSPTSPYANPSPLSPPPHLEPQPPSPYADALASPYDPVIAAGDSRHSDHPPVNGGLQGLDFPHGNQVLSSSNTTQGDSSSDVILPGSEHPASAVAHQIEQPYRIQRISPQQQPQQPNSQHAQPLDNNHLADLHAMRQLGGIASSIGGSVSIGPAVDREAPFPFDSLIRPMVPHARIQLNPVGPEHSYMQPRMSPSNASTNFLFAPANSVQTQFSPTHRNSPNNHS